MVPVAVPETVIVKVVLSGTAPEDGAATISAESEVGPPPEDTVTVLLSSTIKLARSTMILGV